jgi:uncharacterized protein (DUF1501 family)
MTSSIDFSRRRFLRAAAAAGIGGAALGPFAQLQALAQSASGEDYRALVCLFMFGGNDGNNLLLPYEPADHARYATLRSNLALARDTLRPIAPTNTGGTQYALHPAFAGLQSLFAAGKAAMLPNIGPLMVPTTKAQWSARSVPLPSNLFSHSDQQAAWQSDILDTPGRSGWGGRMLERVVADGSSNRGYACVSVAGGNIWSAGDRTLVPYRVSPSGNFGFKFYKPGGTDALSQAVAGMLAETRGDPFEQSWLNSVGRSVENQRILSGALTGASLATVFPTTDLGRQMSMIAKLISVRASLGLNRQCFFCSIGGFDTHGSDQLNTQADRFAQIDAAVVALQAAAEEMGLGDKVTLFTASDFGRTFVSNGQGSDHGWGNHHFAVGGAVNGGRLAGTFPEHVSGGKDDVGSGNWLPTTSVDQLGRELGRWFGVGSVLGEVFPRMGYFDDNLALMRA